MNLGVGGRAGVPNTVQMKMPWITSVVPGNSDSSIYEVSYLYPVKVGQQDYCLRLKLGGAKAYLRTGTLNSRAKKLELRTDNQPTVFFFYWKVARRLTVLEIAPKRNLRHSPVYMHPLAFSEEGAKKEYSAAWYIGANGYPRVVPAAVATKWAEVHFLAAREKSLLDYSEKWELATVSTTNYNAGH